MTFLQLKYFLTVAEEGQITSAATKLHMTQPPLSLQLRQLEDSLGVKLFNRTTKGIELTAAGRLLYSHGTQILTMVNNMSQELRDVAHGTSGTIQVGIISSAVNLLLNLDLYSFCTQNPWVAYNLIESDTFSLLDMLDQGIIHVAFVRTPFSSKEYMSFPLFSEPVVAVAGRAYQPRGGLIGHDPAEPITLEQLAGEKLILLQNYENTVLTACQQQGIKPNIICRGSNATVAFLCARSGMGVMLTPKNVLGPDADRDLQVWDVDCGVLTSSLCMVWKFNRELPQAVDKFILHVKERFPGDQAGER